MSQPEPQNQSIAAPTNQTVSRAWYSATIAESLADSPDAIVGRLTTHCDFTVLPTQRDAWLVQISLLQDQLQGLDGSIHMEFSIPRMGRRIDAVLLLGAAIFVVEFKVGD